MKVCLLIPFYHPHAHGGLESYALELARGLKSRGYQVSVITRGERDARLPDVGNGEIYQIKRPAFRAFLEVSRKRSEWFAMHMDEMFSGRAAREARRLIGEIQPDVLFSQSFYGFGRHFPGMLTGTGIPWLHYVHSYGLLCKRETAMKRGHACLRQCLDCKAISIFKQGPVPLRRAITIYNSEHVRHFFEASGVVAQETHVIDPVLSYEAGALTKDNQATGRTRLIFVGRVSAEKGLELLCEAVKLNAARYTLDVLGDGGLLDQLQTRYADAPITFHGRVEPEKRDEMLSKAHMLVAPSLWAEPFGRVVQEGFLAGLPVIAANVGAMGGLVRDGVDGVVFDWRGGDPVAELTGALERATEMLGTLRKGALVTRQELMGRDNLARVEELLLRAAGVREAAARP